uniref:Uncharacterized protein n=1 Tax=Helianthus annuus TaxID=4232 RepID=A0A251RRQ3_HELAN
MCLGGQNSSCSKFHSYFKFYSFKSRPVQKWFLAPVRHLLMKNSYASELPMCLTMLSSFEKPGVAPVRP